jgi:hypothetical protein
VRDAGRHFAKRRQPVAKPLALFTLLHEREVLEKHHRADRPAGGVVFHVRERVANHAIEILQPQLEAVRQMFQFERCRQNSYDVGPRTQHFDERPSDVLGAGRQRKDAVRLLVHQGQRAVPTYGEHPVRHAADEVPENRSSGPLERWAVRLYASSCRPSAPVASEM